jgi:signal transduction histidine kinase
MGGALIEFSDDRRQSHGRRTYDRFNLAAMRGVVHDVVNSISAIGGLIESVLGDDGIPTGARRRLSLVHREHEHLTALLEQFLDETRTGSLRPVDVRDVVESVAALAAGTTAARVTVLDGPDVTVTTDPVAVWRTLHNVVGNAVRAAGPRGWVEIVVTRDRDTLRIDVVDSGPGFGSAGPGRECLGLELVGVLLAGVGGRASLVEGTGPRTRVRVEIPVAGPPASDRGPGKALGP